jgi:hypothetical protein
MPAMRGGFEGFEEKHEKEQFANNKNVSCLFTTQGEVICGVDTEYNKWLVNNPIIIEKNNPFSYQRANFTGFNIK